MLQRVSNPVEQSSSCSGKIVSDTCLLSVVVAVLLNFNG